MTPGGIFFSQIRRFGTRREQFIFEAGSRCVSGEGIFAFHTEQAREIQEKTDACRAHKSCGVKKGLVSKTHCSDSALRNPALPKSEESQSHHDQLHGSRHSAHGDLANDVEYLTLLEEDPNVSADRPRSPSGYTSAYLAPTVSPTERSEVGKPGEKVKHLIRSSGSPVPTHGSTASLLSGSHTIDVPGGYVDMYQGKLSEKAGARGGSRRQGKPLTPGRRLAEGSDSSGDELENEEDVYMTVQEYPYSYVTE